MTRGTPPPPLSPPGQPLPLPQPETPPIPEPAPIIIPRLPQPLLTDEYRRHVLYTRYSVLNLGGDDDLIRMASTVYAQAIVERYVEAALVEDGFHPQSILRRYPEIRSERDF